MTEDKLRQYFENSGDLREDRQKIKKICKDIDKLASNYHIVPMANCTFDRDNESFEIILPKKINFSDLKNFAEKSELSVRSMGGHTVVLDTSGKALRLRFKLV